MHIHIDLHMHIHIHTHIQGYTDNKDTAASKNGTVTYHKFGKKKHLCKFSLEAITCIDMYIIHAQYLVAQPAGGWPLCR